MPTDPTPTTPEVPILWDRGCEALVIAVTADPAIYRRLVIGAERNKASIVETLIMARERGLI